MRRSARAFTVIELLVVIVIVGLLTLISTVAYNGVQYRANDSLVKVTVEDAFKTLMTYAANNDGSVPSNVANTNFVPPLTVALILYTNAAQAPVYQNLSPDQNAQLFLNSCNANMPVVSGGTTYNTSCSYSGNNVHVAGQVSSNVVISGPTITQSQVVLTCGSACTTAQNNMVSVFLAQGGTFPITVPKNGATLPAPTLVTTGLATQFCLEGRSPLYSTILYHAQPPTIGVQSGPCPSNPLLHYP